MYIFKNKFNTKINNLVNVFISLLNVWKFKQGDASNMKINTGGVGGEDAIILRLQ
jgi:hypothetical protein